MTDVQRTEKALGCSYSGHMASQWSSVEEDPSDVFSDDSDRIQRFFHPAPGLKYSL